ncbi:MAG: methyltransferase domain-containing protein [Fluviicola sp.]|nr:methyltransferase domain-containing protein [Fluviicola sp.]
MSISAEVKIHIEYLRDFVFKSTTFHPHYNLLIDGLLKLQKNLPHNANVSAFERTIQYGGYSLFAPLFEESNFTSFELSPPDGDIRGAYNDNLIKDKRFIASKYTYQSEDLDINLDDYSQDLIFIPNLVHHVKDQNKLFLNAASKLKKGGKLFVFEPFVREIHLMPYDYLRYTPEGLSELLKSHGLVIEEVKTFGGPFEVISYTWAQAIEYLPEELRSEIQEWFVNTEMPRLLELNTKYTENLVRKDSMFPMSFSIVASKNGV